MYFCVVYLSFYLHQLYYKTCFAIAELHRLYCIISFGFYVFISRFMKTCLQFQDKKEKELFSLSKIEVSSAKTNPGGNGLRLCLTKLSKRLLYVA